MTAPQFDIVAIGNALVDVLSHQEDEFVVVRGITKGLMAPIAPQRAVVLHREMGICEEVSGGSAANTLAALAGAGARCAFVGQVGDDRLGTLFADDLHRHHIAFDVAPLPEVPTGRCLIIVHPDGHRTMNTAIGASEYLPPASLDPALIASSGILYVEGYMFRTEQPRARAIEAIGFAREAGRKVAFTLSSEFCISEHGDEFRGLIADGLIDILFANDGELCAITGIADFDAALAHLATQVPLLIVTCGPEGAVGVAGGKRFDVPAEPAGPVVDTTGAGDAFAAGVFAGLVRGEPLPVALRMGSVVAGEIITRIGPRFREGEDVAALISERMGR
ncbi:adenosine kinase [Sphingomonas montanisoli]|uniref:Adenosine kinase n=1 Tax=Sphingomonas montanisoli TaxID=2606412 RepID=A0A5D9C4L3_9SPHN|nr:adenosine kinase [Sphingomonas montanisoli]TZG26413.1 adenosine kinase [Sphingomonas montanisoli]